MGGFNCRVMPVDVFNSTAAEQGMSVASRDGLVDRRDTFEQQSENGAKRLAFGSRSVQSIIRLWRSDCQALKRRAASREFKALARAFKIEFGPPAAMAEGEAERLGVYKNGRHLFDVDASSGAGAAGPAPSAQFTEKQLARLISEGLGEALPARYSARVEIGPEALSEMMRMGVRIDEARQEIRGPSGELFCYGGSADSGFTKDVTIEAPSDTSLRVTMLSEDGKERVAIFPLKPRGGPPAAEPAIGPERTPIPDDPYGDDDSEPPAEIRPAIERGKKGRILTGPGMSITVYE
ncbi:MAG: hypothetical protein JXA24_05215 [Proteobacteria bacterium]|nr:hypothetical protein [Pseudomonadota bacterium]